MRNLTDDELRDAVQNMVIQTIIISINYNTKEKI